MVPSTPLPCPALRWDVFCRVVDNHGDLGVCWRLCTQLAAAGEEVRLWCDDASALAWMAGPRIAAVQLRPWREPLPDEAPGDVVVEAFGCNPPPGFVARMAAKPHAPVWVNLEYLSAQPYVERSHGLASPQLYGPGTGLTKWFFYPGFTPATGGLLREAGLAAARAAFNRNAFLQALGAAPRDGEQVVSLFAYQAEALDGLLSRLAPRPVLLLACPGAARDDAVRACHVHPHVRCHFLPWLAQDGYDRLLWAADLNLVRGEDSFVRAQWAGRPFLWQIYAQQDGAHASKLAAFLQRFLADAVPTLQSPLQAAFEAWNGLSRCHAPLPGLAPWREHCERWQQSLSSQGDLVTQLRQFIARRLLGSAR